MDDDWNIIQWLARLNTHTLIHHFCVVLNEGVPFDTNLTTTCVLSWRVRQQGRVLRRSVLIYFGGGATTTSA